MEAAEKVMPEQQGDSSEPSRNPSTDKPEHQRGTNMDGKSQKTIHMLYKLMSKIVTINGKIYKPRN